MSAVPRIIICVAVIEKKRKATLVKYEGMAYLDE
jgi:hypothetical protein